MTLNSMHRAGTYDSACKIGYAALERLLADPRLDPASCNNAAICLACCDGHLDVVELAAADHPLLLGDAE